MLQSGSIAPSQANQATSVYKSTPDRPLEISFLAAAIVTPRIMSICNVPRGASDGGAPLKRELRWCPSRHEWRRLHVALEGWLASMR